MLEKYQRTEKLRYYTEYCQHSSAASVMSRDKLPMTKKVKMTHRVKKAGEE